MGSVILHQMPSGHLYGVWAIQRPNTKRWGSGRLWGRICEALGVPDVAFGKTDGIPEHVLAIDQNTGYEWAELPFGYNEFDFGYWDPPYDKLYKPEGQEIWRTCRKLAVLHTHIYPTSWFAAGKRIATIAVTYGPLKVIRCLQVFEKEPQQLKMGSLAPTTGEPTDE